MAGRIRMYLALVSFLFVLFMVSLLIPHIH
jgi:hypothetical protein